MKTGTKIGWALVALAIFISVWVLSGGIGRANTTETDAYGNSYEIDDSGIVVGFTYGGSTVVVPASATAIGDGVFANQPSITDVDASHVTNIGSNAFSGCTSLASVNIASASNIGGSAFDTCSSLSSVTLSGSLANIGDNAFRNCVNLVGVTIPANVSYISSGAFNGCSKLASINVDPSNPYYSSDGIALYSNSGTTLCIVPPAAGAGDSTYTVANGCTQVAEYAFTGNSNIKVLHLPASVATWGNQHGFAPNYIYMADDYQDSLRTALQAEYDGITTVIATEGGAPTPVPPPGPVPGTYAITSIVENTNGTVTINFSGPDVTGGSIKGQALQEGVNGYKDTSSGTTVITLTKEFVDGLRPASGTISVPVVLSYGGTDYNGAFSLSAPSTPTPTPSYTVTPTYSEKATNSGAYVMTTTSTAGNISGVVVQNLGDYNLAGNYLVENYGTGSRITIYDSYISTLSRGGKYVFKILFADGASPVTSTLQILGGGSGGGGGSSSGGGSRTNGSSSSVSGTSYTQPASSTLYGNGAVTTTTASSTTGTSHTKDTTPSTADGWDARLAFAIALLLAGVVVLMRSRSNAAKLEMIRKDRE